MTGDYPTHLDEIDQWLFDSFGIIPGACSSIENLRYDTARMVAEALWPKKDTSLTQEDVRTLDHILYKVDYENAAAMSDGKDIPYDGDDEFYTEVLHRFNEQRKK